MLRIFGTDIINYRIGKSFFYIPFEIMLSMSYRSLNNISSFNKINQTILSVTISSYCTIEPKFCIC